MSPCGVSTSTGCANLRPGRFSALAAALGSVLAVAASGCSGPERRAAAPASRRAPADAPRLLSPSPPPGAPATAEVPARPSGLPAAGDVSPEGSDVRPLAPRDGEPPDEGEFPRTVFPRSTAYQGRHIDIAAGDIAALEIIRFLADYTGTPVVLDSTNPQILRNPISLGARIQHVTGEVAIAILKANGFACARETVPSGDIVLKVSYGGPPVAPGCGVVIERAREDRSHASGGATRAGAARGPGDDEPASNGEGIPRIVLPRSPKYQGKRIDFPAADILRLARELDRPGVAPDAASGAPPPTR